MGRERSVLFVCAVRPAADNGAGSGSKKFALEGWNVIFTGRNAEKTARAESEYRALFPNVKITGYALNSLTADGTVDEQSVTDLFDELDKKCVVIDCLVLNPSSCLLCLREGPCLNGR